MTEKKIRLYIGDLLNVFETQELGKYRLILTDPPYNIGWKYHGRIRDKRADYDSWCFLWAQYCFEYLEEDGILAIINYPENNNKLYTVLVESGYNYVQQLVWTYPTNIGQSKRKYTRSYRTVLIFSKSEKYIFNGVKGTYKNPTDKRIKERLEKGFAPLLYDVWDINLQKNVGKDKKKKGINQLPKELVKRLILTYTEEGDRVMDPFAGNGTVLDVADEFKRYATGIDIYDYDVYPKEYLTFVDSSYNHI